MPYAPAGMFRCPTALALSKLRRIHGGLPLNSLKTLAVAMMLAASASQSGAAVSCQALDAADVAATAIGLPTRGAHVDSASVVRATADTGEYCKLLGRIVSVDASAPPIKFQLNLPMVWNQKSMQLGGGGFDGTLVTGEGNVSHALAGSKTPLQRGYATFGSDSGHTGLHIQGRFALNEEALRNFTGDALKKLRDVAMQLIQRRYGQAPWKSYISGGSSGGRETLAAIQRWPADYDGAVAHYPVLQYTATGLQANRMAQALYAPGGFVNSAKMNHMNDQVLAACDALDGVADGFINNVSACHYDPAPLRCYGNIDWGPHCLTDAQLTTVRSFDAPLSLRFAFENGTTPQGYNIFAGANFGGPVDVGWSSVPLDAPTPVINGYLYTVQSEWLKYFVTGNPAYDFRQFNPQTGSAWQARLHQLSKWHDAASLNLTPFAQRGGKLLMLHGTSDTIVSPRGTVDYFNRLRAQYGAQTLSSFLRLYMVAGFGHGEGRFTASWNALDLLEAWAERGQPPVNPTTQDALSLVGRTRPLCDYPMYPRYRAGPVDAAASFECALP